MKRGFDLSLEEAKRLKSTFDSLLQTLESSDLSFEQLNLLSSAINRQYAAKANKISQYFPFELWMKILPSLAHTPIEGWISYRTVCRSWNQAILQFPKLLLSKKIGFPTKVAQLFPNLTTLWLDPRGGMDVSSLTQLKKLILFNWTDDSAAPKGLSSLTRLETLSSDENNVRISLPYLTNLKKLTFDCVLREDIPNLLKLTKLNYLCIQGSECVTSDSFRPLTSLKTLLSHDPSFFRGDGPGIYVEEVEYDVQDLSCRRRYEGAWSDVGLHMWEGKGSLWYPFWGAATSPYWKQYKAINWAKRRFTRSGLSKGGSEIFGAQWVRGLEMKKENWICLFDGYWRRGRRHGYGTYSFKDGAKWHGYWEKGVCHGEGTYESEQKEIIYKGTWQGFLATNIKPELPREQGDAMWASPH